jgi:hypothetical protein
MRRPFRRNQEAKWLGQFGEYPLEEVSVYLVTRNLNACIACLCLLAPPPPTATISTERKKSIIEFWCS